MNNRLRKAMAQGETEYQKEYRKAMNNDQQLSNGQRSIRATND